MRLRRDFLRLLGLSAALPALPAAAATNGDGGNRPVVVSTWNFGEAANAAAWEILAGDGGALDAVEAGARVPEADPGNHSVGLGGYPDRDGHVTLDACIMDHAGNLGAVACLEDVVHAVSVARRVMEKTPHVLLVGDGARRFAASEGFPRQNLLTPEAKRAWQEWLATAEYRTRPNSEQDPRYTLPDALPGGERNHDTIGILALDRAGRLAGACTTSGMAFKMRGRVGDSPISGAGLFVDGEVGAASATGVGEECLRICGSHTVVELMRQGRSPERACREAVERIARRYRTPREDLQMAFVALRGDGRVGACALQPGFSYALRTTAGTRVVEAPSLL
ncbi:N(4)-(beta-N-acetylglucosaminyl)-L-asparaginase [Luteimonas sp. RD2P54]|uniref:N(4)-(Beta-N-acetylglucosaminyl)-L-asparaginase n=1 Tax=Luteimonas endophytica TaxID=3042023 RepID=A0ABT6JDW0_9GAMM|nr:N(4)-(beta-N-acetylglucosaminyl)-L-asparaginase [Luteimonas endophytica]MDH5825016.1 N(4)-(beta-N-acetylglucosaminyl)-L-asparaginase [Luteimonas endophytica]